MGTKKQSIWYEDPAELSRRRKSVGLSQAELARRTAMSPSTIRDLENGRIKLRGERAEQLWNVIVDQHRRVSLTSNAFAEAIHALEAGGTPSSSHAREITLPSSEVFAAVRKQIQLEEELVQHRTEIARLTMESRDLSDKVRELCERCDKLAAAQGQRILEEEATRS